MFNDNLVKTLESKLREDSEFENHVEVINKGDSLEIAGSHGVFPANDLIVIVNNDEVTVMEPETGFDNFTEQFADPGTGEHKIITQCYKIADYVESLLD